MTSIVMNNPAGSVTTASPNKPALPGNQNSLNSGTELFADQDTVEISQDAVARYATLESQENETGQDLGPKIPFPPYDPPPG